MHWISEKKKKKELGYLEKYDHLPEFVVEQI